jgi:signal transduction histidine kinase
MPKVMQNAMDLATAVTGYLTQTNALAYAHLDPEFKITQTSPNFTQGCLLAPQGGVKGLSISELLWEFVGAEEALQDVLHGRMPAFSIEQVQREQPNGQICYLSFLIIPFETGNPSAGMMLLVRDTTHAGVMEQHLLQERNELRLAQSSLSRANVELQRLNRLKSLFLSMAAHDLRTPLTVIHGFAELLLSGLGEETPPTREYLLMIATQTEWLDRLITDLLSINQIEEGQLVLQPMAHDLNSLVDSMASGIENLAKTKGLTFQVEQAQASTAVFADPERVKQILYNLLGNAVKYTPPQGVIRLRTWAEDQLAVIEVSDTGRGMTREQQSQLFKPYYRTEEARRGRTQGAGMGLYIVKTLVEALHGRIDVHSSPGAGATFTVRLPAAP